MDSSSSSPPPPPPGLPRPMPPQVVYVQSKPGGTLRAVAFIVTLLLFALAFIVGIVFGIVAMTIDRTVVVEQTYRDGDRNKIVILPVEGIIDDRRAAFVRTATRHILDDARVSAVILRVDSPGGGVSASDQIWYEIERLKNNGLPVVASYGGIAASGGYYVSCAADYIVAEETCITGSVGVIAQVLTLEDMLNKIGIEPVTIVATDSPGKDVANTIFRRWDERDRQKYLQMIDAAHEIFQTRVRDGRQHVITDEARLASLTDGSIFTAQQALDAGLIDAIGYLDAAIRQAETLAGLRPGRARVVRIADPPTFFGRALFARPSPTGGDLFDADRLRALANDLASPRVMYLMP